MGVTAERHPLPEPSSDRQQDAELLRVIHDEHGPALTKYVLRLTRGDREFAMDVIQESLLRLWQTPSILAVTPNEAARAWLHTVAKNLVIDGLRRAWNNREVQTESPPEHHGPDVFGPVVDSCVLSDALLTLSVEHRTVIVRTHYFGETAVEIAEHEQIPLGTVKSRLHYALRALRAALQEKDVSR